MICEEARMQLLREIGGETQDAEARDHLAGCATCSDYRRDAQRVWDQTGRAVETCPRRRNVFQRNRRAPSALFAGAAAILAAVSVVAWAVRPNLRTTPAQDPDAKGEELLQKDPEFRKQVVRAAVEEKERLEQFEKKLAEADRAYAEANALLKIDKIKDACERAESALNAFPYLKLAILDPMELRHRSSVLRYRLREVALTAKIGLLKQQPEPGDATGLAERAEVEVKLINQLRECKRSLEVLAAEGPQRRKHPIVELGGAQLDPRAEVIDRLRAIRMTIDSQDGSLKDTVKYLREISGLNMVLMEGNPPPITLHLQDAIMEGVLDHLAKLAGYTWEVDRFGIISFSPTRK
jgi:hypothetical protein